MKEKTEAKHHKVKHEEILEEHKPEVETKEVKVEETSDDTHRVDSLESCLIWLRDEVVNGNDNHVKKINSILRRF